MFKGALVSPSTRVRRERGFTLIELLVVITILGVLAAVVVFAVRGVGDKGKAAALTTDAGVVRTAEEAFCAKNGKYGTMADLVQAGLLASKSTYTAVALTAGGACGSASSMTSAFMLGYGQPNNGSPSSIGSIKLAAASGGSLASSNGYPEPFGWFRGPGYANVNYLFDPLVWRDATGNPVPWLAKSWTESLDGLTWTFTLRDGVKWSDSTSASPQYLTPDDVAFTFAYQTGSPSTGCAYCGAANSSLNQGFYKSYFPYINTVVANDGPGAATGGTAGTVTFNLNTAFNTFMGNIGQELVILPQHIWSSILNPFPTGTSVPTTPPPANEYVGTGPYLLNNPSSYNPLTGVAEYDANTNFFLGTPYVKKLLFVTPTSGVTGPTTDLLSGNLDAAAPGSNEYVTAADLAPLAALPSIKNPGGWNRSIEFNFFAGFPYNNVKFRQALAYAINRPDLITRNLSGNAQVPSLGTMSPSSPYLAPNLPTYSFSTPSANALLDSIGMTAPAACGGVAGPSCARTLPGGAPFTAQIRTTSRFDTTNLDPVLTSYLAAIGINLNYAIDANDNNATQGNYSMMIEGWGDISADPDNLRTRMADAYTGVLTASCTPGASLHNGCYANSSFTNVYGWNPSNNAGGTDHSADFMLKAGYCGTGAAPALGPGPLPCDPTNSGELTTTSTTQRLADLQAMQADVAADVPEIQLYVPTAILYYQTSTLSAWYNTPGGTPPGPPSFFNKEVFVTGTQFGLPPGF